jgi:uncharacterized protein YqjF (DUF2071 family)
MTKTFLSAEWRKLAMANYAVDRNVLKEFVPHHTELDSWNDTCYVSLVGFMFVNTRLLGFKIPFHTNFEEVNLRFYVRFKQQGEWKRGVVFIKEIVPRPMLTLVANTLYHENYETMAMKHSWNIVGDSLSVEYQWKKKEWNSFKVTASSQAVDISEGSEEEFITEHFWGYTRIGDHKTSEYGVEHPRWKVYPVHDFTIKVDFESVYGKTFGFLTELKPKSVFLAEGSEILVKEGHTIS